MPTHSSHRFHRFASISELFFVAVGLGPLTAMDSIGWMDDRIMWGIATIALLRGSISLALASSCASLALTMNALLGSSLFCFGWF